MFWSEGSAGLGRTKVWAPGKVERIHEEPLWLKSLGTFWAEKAELGTRRKQYEKQVRVLGLSA